MSKDYEMIRALAMQYVAHDSGDGQTVFHCPFCGSGQVVGRSDGTVECSFCFAGETEYITWDGIRTLKETVGTTQTVLVSTAATKRGNGKTADVGLFGGQWVDAEIKSFGVQPLMRVVLKRNGIEREIFATPEHRWFTTPFVRLEGYTYAKRVITETQHLKAGDRLMSVFTKDRVRQNIGTVPSPFGVAHGFVFGDGSLCVHGGAQVVLWGAKDQALLPYFAASRQRPIQNGNGTSGIEVKDLPQFFKDYPIRSESLSYLYGWLAGYFAADGSVGKNGVAKLDCASREVLEFVQILCSQLGIGTYGITEASRIGFPGRESSDIFSLTFVASTLTSEFFIIPEHRDRFEARTGRREMVTWTVESVEESDRVEEVFCAVVPEYENFALVGNVNVMNCHTHFTVQVQPEFQASPQTIDGESQDMEGMPGGVDPNEAPVVPGEGDDAGMVDPAASQDEEEAEGAEDAPEGDNPFSPKSSAKTAMYVTTDGEGVLPEDAYLRHLAIRFADDIESVLEQVKVSR